MALTEIPIELSSTPGIVDNSNATAITIDASENVGIGTSTITNPYSQSNFTDVNINGVWGGAISFKLGGVTKGWVGQRSSGNEDMVIGATAGQELLFYENNVEAMRISSGNVGIGVVPAARFDVMATGVNQWYIRNTDGTAQDNSITSLRSGGYSNIALDGETVQLKTSGTIRARIDATGSLNVSRSAYTSASTNGFHANADGWTHTSVSGEPTAYFNRNTSDGEVVRILKDGATVGSIGSYLGSGTSQFFIAGADTGFKFNSTVDVIAPSDSIGGTRDAAIDLGDAGSRFRNLYLSGGAYLGGTAAANKLDDYEEGTWTPAFANMGTGTYTTQYGTYTKVGNLVTASVHIDINVLGTASGSLEITPLPFTSSAASIYNYGNASAIHAQNFTAAAEGLNVLIFPNTATASIYSGAGTTSAAVSVTHAVMGTGNFLCTLVYFTA